MDYGPLVTYHFQWLSYKEAIFSGSYILTK